jgi:hypothetical protein
MFLKYDPYRVWCSIFYSKLVDCILFKIIVQHVRFVKGRGTCGSGERNVKILIDFRKSPRFSLTSPLSQKHFSTIFWKSQVTNWVREILVTFENQSSIIYWFLLRYTVIIYKFTQGNLGAKKLQANQWIIQRIFVLIA